MNIRVMHGIYKTKNYETYPLISQLHQRISLAFCVFVFMLIASPMAILTHRRERTLNLGLAVLIFAVYYLLLIGFGALSQNGNIDPALSIWIPNIIFSAIGLFLIIKLCVS